MTEALKFIGGTLVGAVVLLAPIIGFSKLEKYGDTPEYQERMIKHRASGNIVRSCASGGTISQDPVTKRYSFYQKGGAFFDAGAASGVLPVGTTPEEFCK